MLACFDKDFKVTWISGTAASLATRLAIKSSMFKINNQC